MLGKTTSMLHQCEDSSYVGERKRWRPGVKNTLRAKTKVVASRARMRPKVGQTSKDLEVVEDDEKRRDYPGMAM